MSVPAHRIRLAGNWSVQQAGSEWLITRRFHHPTGLLPSTRLRLHLASPPSVTLIHVHLNGTPLSASQPTLGVWISPIDLELLRPFNQIEVRLHCHPRPANSPTPTLIPNPSSTFLHEAWLELQDEPAAT